MDFLPFVAGYLAIITALAIYFSRRIKSSEDFAVAGRSLGTLVVAGTLLATWMGGGTILGTAEFIYTYGPLAGALYCAIEPIGIALFFLISRRIYLTKKTTISEILYERYGSFASLISAIAIVLAYVGILSYQIDGMGMIISYSSAINPEISYAVALIVMVVITISGGLLSVAYTDSMSAILITLALLLGIPFALSAAGGFSGIASSIPPENLTIGSTLSPVQWIGYFLPTILLVLGDQNMYQRIFAAKDEGSARHGTLYWLLGCVIINVPIIILAVSSRALALLPMERADEAIIAIASSTLPFVIGGIILATAAAFLLTTGDSYLLSSATVTVYDIIARYSRREIRDKTKLSLQRLLVIVFALLSFVMIRFFPSALSIQMFAYTIYGATITPALLGGLLWKGATKEGGIASMIVGIFATLIAEWTVTRAIGINSVVVSAPLSFITLIIISLLTKKKNSDAI